MSKLIIVEGPDCSGKTSLSKRICLDLPMTMRLHASGDKMLHTVMEPYHYALLDSTEQLMREGFNVVLDRHWPSEVVYGSIFRPLLISKYDAMKMCARANDMGARYIFCMDDMVQQRHKAEMNPDHPYQEHEFAAVVGDYRGMMEGMKNKFPDRYHHYDLTRDGTDMSAFLKKVIA